VRESDFGRTLERLRDGRPTMLVLDGPIMGARFRLTRLPAVGGRDDECSIILPDDAVSGRHFEVFASDSGRLLLRDLNSLNGTIVNGAYVSEHVLEVGDRLLIGHTPLRFVVHTSAEEELLQSLETRATHDPLTGLANRSYFDQRLEDEIAFMERHGTLLTLMLADLDHFKRVNDTYGHTTGDRVLVRVAATLKSCLRAEDVLARVGGEELAVILRQTAQMGAVALAERMRHAVELSAVQHGAHRVTVTISTGVATAVGGCGIKGPGLFELADTQLYKAKNEGRNRVCSTTV
jgi:diguanylate cyclase (GGDEF)-like protein